MSKVKRVLAAAMLSAAVIGLAPAVSSAADEQRIVDVAGNALLMEDGSLWIDNLMGPVRHKLDLTEIAGMDGYGYGLTKNGELVTWASIGKPEIDPDLTGIKQLNARGFALKSDGTVWSGAGKIDGMTGVVRISEDNGLAALTEDGRLLGVGAKNLKATVPNPQNVSMIASAGDRAAVLDNDGEITLYEGFNFGADTFELIPTKLAAPAAAHVAYAANDILIVTLKDGTVWTNGAYQERYKLTKQIEGIGQAEMTVPYGDEEQFSFYAKRTDGTWVRYENGEIGELKSPYVASIEVNVSQSAVLVGDAVKIDIAEKYSNGALKKIPLSEANVAIDKPYLLKIQPDGTLKALGVGEAKVTVTSGSASKTVSVSIGGKSALQFSVVKDGIVYLPVQSTFKALGGTSAYAATSKTFSIRVGDTPVTLTLGSTTAAVNGKKIKLKAAPRTENGMAVFPAHLLADAFGAKTAWDSKLKQATVSFGQASLTVVSAETAGIVKKAAQGSLSRFIGRTYWVNYFQQWDRFMKVTVADIVPDDTGYFSIVFKSASGKSYTSYAMPASNVEDLFADSYYFLNYDPYKKYNWSQAVWTQIKSGQISAGMTKEQVLLSWGTPVTKSTVTGSGTTVETWGYPSFNFVSFVNGKVTLIVN
ncbi:stalk domain-containing protein [Cohnella algarum]|uniref:stalk domain-containing protein n=1 Tax=Cohnella algarum TaxID=2044859 RepID=UPI001967D571|nr:copper amine oxidase N-terminal domain-containing protein [Cohnella algarum]MBN2984009.1 copper amine oxidase [Cohnella algarum]